MDVNCPLAFIRRVFKLAGNSIFFKHFTCFSLELEIKLIEKEKITKQRKRKFITYY